MHHISASHVISTELVNITALDTRTVFSPEEEGKSGELFMRRYASDSL